MKRLFTKLIIVLLFVVLSACNSSSNSNTNTLSVAELTEREMQSLLLLRTNRLYLILRQMANIKRCLYGLRSMKQENWLMID